MTFNPHLALRCAQTIQALYTHDIEPNVVDRATDTQALVQHMSEGHYGIFIPGTASWQDCLTDARIRKVNYGAGRLHLGFKQAADSIYTTIVRRLPLGASLTISGHSLGGALATILADWLHGSGYRIHAVITLGSPRVANGPWARTYNRILGDCSFRLVNAGDPVPHVPWVLGTYRHVDTLVYLKKDGSIESNFLLAAAHEQVSRFTHHNDESDTAEFIRPESHSLNAYIAQLQALTN